MKYTIYTLRSPESDEIRYVGYTGKQLFKRLAEHIKNVTEARNNSRHWNKRLSWINSLLCKGLNPIIEELEICESSEIAKSLEIYWISQLKQWGFKLTNMTRGGDGGDTYSEKSIEELQIIGEKISSKIKGIRRSEISINKFRETIRINGHWLTKPGSVNPNKGKTMSNEQKEKISKSKFGKKLSSEHIDKLRGHTPKNKNVSKYPSIIQYIDNDITIAEFSTAGEAIIALSLPTCRQSEIIRCCKGITKKAFGYKWRFKING